MLRSDEMVTPRRRTWSLAKMVSSPRRNGSPLPTRAAEPYLEPAQRSSVLSAFSLSLFAAIQWLTSDMQLSSHRIAVVMSLRWHCRYNWVSSAYEWILTACAAAMSARSAVYKINKRGPRTEPCSTEQTIKTTYDVLPPNTTWNVLSDRYELNHWRTGNGNI